MKSTPTRRIAAVALLAAAVSAYAQEQEQAPGGDNIRVVALDGDEVDGLEIVPIGGRDLLGIAGNGAVLFDANTSNGLTYFHHRGTTTRTIVRRNDMSSLPGFELVSIEGAVLGLTGNVGIDAYYDGAPDTEARLTWFDGTLSVVATAPGSFSDLQLGSWGFNGESFVFRGQVPITRAEPRFSTQRHGMWRSFGGLDPEPLLQQDEPMPGLPGFLVSSVPIGAPLVHASGATAFRVIATRQDPLQTRTRLVVFPAAGSNVDPVSMEPLDRPSFGALADGADFPHIAGFVETESGLGVADPSGAIVLTHGQVVGDKTVRLDSRSRLALCDRGQIVVMAHREGGSSGIETLWRHTPGEEATAELFVGQMIPDTTGTPREIKDIWNVHVNEQGRVAAEVDLALFGTTQVIVIQDEAGGPFRVAIQQRETFAADRDDYEVTGIVSRRPTHFTFTGTGHDGRQSRFAPDGSFVFKARVDTESDPDDKTGIFVLRGPPRDLCDIKARVRGKRLEIVGEDEGCDLTIAVTDGGEVFLRPGEGSSVNGEEGEVEMTIPRDLRISMRGGNDRLRIISGFGDSDPGELPGNVVIDMGEGDDDVELDYLEIARSLQVRMGSDRGALEKVRLDGVGIDKHLTVLCGPTRTLCELEGVDVAYKTVVQHGGDLGYVSSQACAFLGKTQFRGSDTAETFTFRDCEFEGPLKVDLGTGILGSAKLFDCASVGANVKLDGRRAGAAIFRLEDCYLEAGKLKVATGSRSCDVDLVGTVVEDGVDVKTGGSSDLEDGANTIGFHNSFTSGKLKIRGKGSHTIFAGANAEADEGVDIRLKRGTLDQVSITSDFKCETGGIRIQSKATALAKVNLDEVEVENGAVIVKTGSADDEVRIAFSTIDGGVNAKLGDGDDKLTLHELISFGGIKAAAGPGQDSLLDGGLDPEAIDGPIRTRDFEFDP